jgi:hypothetical protein
MSSRPAWLLPTVVGLWIGIIALAAYEGVELLTRKPSSLARTETAALPPSTSEADVPIPQPADDLARKAAAILKVN